MVYLAVGPASARDFGVVFAILHLWLLDSMNRQLLENALVSFVREKSGHITVMARLSGKPAKLIVDTGAGGTCIHTGSLKHYKLQLATTIRKKGGGVGSVAMSMTKVLSHNLSIGQADLGEFKLLALDLSHVIAGLAKAKVEGVVGVLGADVLNRRQAFIDYARNVVMLSRSSSGPSQN
ncbi:hypothetical protein FSC37_10035 [Piscinibacter aquaticus]|uniref:Peptidase A2 domain-containing protein n=1 Tax=Piscinibacter aquaticus TaxID=392597 RepID=A0A5C6U343_9BURK|nr:hypothetical protein FSC37_10035 [Piscinibacter aquaticus]